MEIPHRPPVLVPVRPGQPGSSLRTCRMPDGTRTGIAFTSAESLRGCLGDTQAFIRLCEPALLTMLADLGVDQLVVDPALVLQPAPSDVRAS